MANTDVGHMLKRILWIASIFMAAALLITMVQKKKTREANDTLILITPLPDGNNLIDAEDVLLTIERSFGHRLVGLPLGALNVERVERILEEDPFILSSDVFVDAENKIHIEVIQREPILRIIDKNGLNYYLDKLGKKMPLSKHFTARVLVATGNIPPYDPGYLDRKGNRMKDLYDLTNIILQDQLLQPLVEHVFIQEKGDFILVPKVGNQKIIIGDLSMMDDKIFRLKTFYKEAVSRLGWNKYRSINLKFKNQVVCKKR